MFIKVGFKKIIGTDMEWDSHSNNIVDLFKSYLVEFHPANILDVGCGDGSRGVRLAEYLNIGEKSIYGIELDNTILGRERKRTNQAVVDLEQGSIPFVDNSFSLVLCNQVLEHLKGYRNILLEIIRITKQNGYIIIGIPNLAHLINRLLLLFGKQPMSISIGSSHVNGFTHSGFLEMLRNIDQTEVIGFKGSRLMYPIPLFIAKHLAQPCVGLTAYTCYLLRKR